MSKVGGGVTSDRVSVTVGKLERFYDGNRTGRIGTNQGQRRYRGLHGKSMDFW